MGEEAVWVCEEFGGGAELALLAEGGEGCGGFVEGFETAVETRAGLGVWVAVEAFAELGYGAVVVVCGEVEEGGDLDVGGEVAGVELGGVSASVSINIPREPSIQSQNIR